MAEDAKQRENNDSQPGGCTGKGWQPGQSGNPHGRPKSRPITDALKHILANETVTLRIGGQKVKITGVEALARVGINKAMEGDPRFWKEILDRSDGKVLDLLDVTSGGETIRPPGLTQAELDTLMAGREGPE